MEILGIDIGFGFTKVTNGREFQIFKSVYGDAADVQFKERLLDDAESGQYRHVDIEGENYFLGELAEQQSRGRSFTLDQDQFVANFVRILSLGALAPMVESNVPFRLVTGLPVGFYRRHKDDLTKQLQKRHTVHTVNKAGEREEKILNIERLRVIPQPFGSVFNLMLNDIGKATERRFLTEKIGIVDVGFRTCDFTVCDKTRYSERGSKSTDSGISQAFTAIAGALQEKSGVNVELYRLYEAVERGTIKIRGKRYDLTKVTEQAFKQLAANIAAEADRLWIDDWDIDMMVITGGGGAALAPHLAPLLNGEVMEQDPNHDARVNNVQGYWKYGVHIWPEG